MTDRLIVRRGYNEMKTEEYNTIGTVSKYNRKFVNLISRVVSL
jgi:hypothetical protein